MRFEIFDDLIFNISSRSYLVINQNQLIILSPHPDHLTVSLEEDKNNISISQIRNLKEWISLKPFSQKEKVVLIEEAQKMTAEAQNSLLKTLEEPPQNSFIILSTKNKKDLLPTVISRCQIILGAKRLLELPKIGESFTIINHSEDNDQSTELAQLNQFSLAEKFSYAEKTAKKERKEILLIIDDWIKEQRNTLLKDRQPQAVTTLRELNLLRQRVAKNVGIRLALENFFLQTS